MYQDTKNDTDNAYRTMFMHRVTLHNGWDCKDEYVDPRVKFPAFNNQHSV